MKKEYNTKVYNTILSYVNEEKEGSFSTNDVYEYLLSKGTEVNLTTIYRNLEKMVKNNVVVKFKSSKSSSSLYRVVDKQINCHRHLHLQCRICGKIYHLDGEYMQEIDQYIKDRYNFDIDFQNSMISGLCFECSQKL